MGASGSTTTLEPSLTHQQANVLADLGRLIRKQIGRGVQPYGGEVAPGASPLQEYGFNALTQQPAMQGEYQSTLGTLLGGTPASAYEVDPAARQDVYEAQERQALQNWQQNVIPSIAEAYNARGLGRSGGLEHELAMSGQNLTSDLASLRANLEYADEEARRAGLESGATRNLQSLLGGAQAYQMGQAQDLSRLGAILGAGEMQRGITAEQQAEDYQRWLQTQPYGNPWLSFLPHVLGTQAYTPVTSSWGFGLTG